MRDLRALLDEAAGGPAGFPDVDLIRRRGRPRLLRRRLLAVAACLVVTLAGWSGARAPGVDPLGHDEQVVSPPMSTSCTEPGTPNVAPATVNGAEQTLLGSPAYDVEFAFGAAWVQVSRPSVSW